MHEAVSNRLDFPMHWVSDSATAREISLDVAMAVIASNV